MSLDKINRQVLLNASMEGVEAVDAMTETLRVEHPHEFHTQESLATRRFFDQPKHEIPHCGFIRPIGEER